MCASLRTCAIAKSSEVEWIVIVGAPDAEITDSEVVASAKISVGWASSMLWRARYCFDWEEVSDLWVVQETSGVSTMLLAGQGGVG